jgi:hypothetical protein
MWVISFVRSAVMYVPPPLLLVPFPVLNFLSAAL